MAIMIIDGDDDYYDSFVVIVIVIVVVVVLISVCLCGKILVDVHCSLIYRGNLTPRTPEHEGNTS